MTPILFLATAYARCRTEYAIADPPEYPFLVFADPPDTRAAPDEEYPPEPTQFQRDTSRENGC